MKSITRILAASAFAAGLGVASQAVAQAEDYPSERVTIIVPYSAGGATDVLARQVAQGLSENWE